MGVSALQITVGRAADMETVVRFFERTAYEIRPVDDETILLRAPGETGAAIARREVEIYLGILERRNPGLTVSLAA
jgi:hypothetical protein